MREKIINILLYSNYIDTIVKGINTSHPIVHVIDWTKLRDNILILFFK